MYPSHVVRINIRTPGEHSLSSLLQIASKILHVKKGTQQNKNTPKTMAKVFVAFLSFLADDFSLFFRLALFTLYMVKRLPLSVAVLYSFLEHLEPSSSEPFRSIDDSERFTNDCVERFDRSVIGCGAITVAAKGTVEVDDVVDESFRLIGTLSPILSLM